MFSFAGLDYPRTSSLPHCSCCRQLIPVQPGVDPCTSPPWAALCHHPLPAISHQTRPAALLSPIPHRPILQRRCSPAVFPLLSCPVRCSVLSRRRFRRAQPSPDHCAFLFAAAHHRRAAALPEQIQNEPAAATALPASFPSKLHHRCCRTCSKPSLTPHLRCSPSQLPLSLAQIVKKNGRTEK